MSVAPALFMTFAKPRFMFARLARTLFLSPVGPGNPHPQHTRNKREATFV
jgi:hypothetical protein